MGPEVPPRAPGHSYDVDAAWRGGSWVWDDVYHTTPWGEYYTRNALRHLRHAATAHRVKTVLDVGAGTGRFAIPLHNWGYSVTALDLDPRALAQLSAREPALRVVEGEFGSVDPGRFDMIVSVGTVKYLESFGQFLALSHEILNPQGILFCEMLNPSSPRHVLTRLMTVNRNPTHFPTQLSPDRCQRAVSASGFTLRWVRGSCLVVPGHTSRSWRLFRAADLLERAFAIERLPSLCAQYYFVALKT